MRRVKLWPLAMIAVFSAFVGGAMAPPAFGVTTGRVEAIVAEALRSAVGTAQYVAGALRLGSNDWIEFGTGGPGVYAPSSTSFQAWGGTGTIDVSAESVEFSSARNTQKVVRATTTDATPTTLELIHTVPTDTSLALKVLLVAREDGGQGGAAFEGLILCDNTVGSIVVLNENGFAGGAQVSLTRSWTFPDDNSHSLVAVAQVQGNGISVYVTGVAGVTYQWTALVQTVGSTE